jgi:hypothetical protein
VPEPRLSAKGDASQRTDLASAWRDAAEAGVQYYTRLGGLALALAEALVPAIGELRPTVRASPDPPTPAAASPDPPSKPGGQTIVIEAAAGRSGLGVFMVENTTTRKVSAPVGVSGFVDAGGREVRPEISFSPDVVSLEPGDQVLVQVAAAVDDTMEPGVRYRAEISIPRLAGAKIPLVVRRRPSTARTTAKARAKRPAKSPRA